MCVWMIYASVAAQQRPLPGGAIAFPTTCTLSAPKLFVLSKNKIKCLGENRA